MKNQVKYVICLFVLLQVITIGHLLYAQDNLDIRSFDEALVSTYPTINTSLDLERFYIPESGSDTYWADNPQPLDSYKVEKDSSGLRNKENYSKEKPEDTFRIGFFGDSFTEGMRVNQSDRWTNQLESRLNQDLNCGNKFQGINFGVRGYDTPYSVEMFLQEGKQYDNDLNIFLFTEDDIRVVNEIYYNPDENDYRSTMSRLTREQLREKQVSKPFEVLSENIEETEKVMIVTAHITPEYETIYREEAEKNGFQYASVHEIGTDLLNNWEKFSFQEIDDPHPNVEGHNIISDFLFISLISNNQVRC